MEELVFLKLGGSLITDKNKPFTERKDVIKRICSEIHNARSQKEFKLVIGNGGGSYPHVPAKKYEVNKGILNKESLKGIALVQDAAASLNRIIVKNLIESGEIAVSYQPSASSFSDKGEISGFFTKPLAMFLEKNIIPVVYGDVVLDIEKGCSILSTEKIFVFLAKELCKIYNIRVIVAGITDGVFTSDPGKDKNAGLINEINDFNAIKSSLSGSGGIDVTGGMLNKVKTLSELADADIEVIIMNGLNSDNIKKALIDENITCTGLRKKS